MIDNRIDKEGLKSTPKNQYLKIGDTACAGELREEFLVSAGKLIDIENINVEGLAKLDKDLISQQKKSMEEYCAAVKTRWIRAKNKFN